MSSYIDLGTICAVSHKQSEQATGRIEPYTKRNQSKFGDKHALQLAKLPASNKISLLNDKISFLVI